MKNRNYLSGDDLTVFENRVRSSGVWCDTKVNDKLRHKFIAKNPYSFLSISLCGTQIVSIDKLHENAISQKCLVCELFAASGKEGAAKLLIRLAQIANKRLKTQTDAEKH